MPINLKNIKTIDLCYENCEVDTIDGVNLLGFHIARKNKSSHTYKEKTTYSIKTFEITLIDSPYRLRTDLAQLTINYVDGSFDHFFISWDKDDCSWDYSSLQKVHKQNNITILTSNCEPSFLTV
jgi:hypothetical protein